MAEASVENSDVGPRANVFSPGKACPERQRGELEAGDVGFIVDTVGCSQAEIKPLEARSNFMTQPGFDDP